MKHLLLGKLLTLASSIVTLTIASEVAIANPDVNRHQSEDTKPFNLVHLGYQGYFQDQGIPGYGGFHSAIETQRVTATRLIESAIEKGKLSPDALNNQDYIDAVETQLQLRLRR